MSAIYWFLVVGFWVFVAAMVCVSVAALRDPLDWLDILFDGIEGAFHLAVGCGVIAALLNGVWLAHVAMFGGAA